MRSLHARGVLLVLVVGLAGCSPVAPDTHVVDDPATLAYPDGPDLAHITLTEDALERLDVQTAPVGVAGSLSTVPSGAVLVDPDGDFWVYTRTGSRSFVRAAVQVVDEEANLAYLASGPDAGTEVVTVGAAELYGVESGIGH